MVLSEAWLVAGTWKSCPDSLGGSGGSPKGQRSTCLRVGRMSPGSRTAVELDGQTVITPETPHSFLPWLTRTSSSWTFLL